MFPVVQMHCLGFSCLDYDYAYEHAHDGTFLLDTQQRKELVKLWLFTSGAVVAYNNVVRDLMAVGF